MKKKIDVRDLPDLRTAVGLHGSLKQTEVGGPICVGIVLGVVYAS